MMKLVACACLFSFAANAQTRVGKPMDEAYSKCLLTNGQVGTYTSDDGGKSAIRLISQCHTEWDNWVANCTRNGGKDGDCTFRSAVLAQSALKLLGR